MHGVRMEGGEKDILASGYYLGFDVSVKLCDFLSSSIFLFFHLSFMSATYVPLYTMPEL